MYLYCIFVIVAINNRWTMGVASYAPAAEVTNVHQDVILQKLSKMESGHF